MAGSASFMTADVPGRCAGPRMSVVAASVPAASLGSPSTWLYLDWAGSSLSGVFEWVFDVVG